MIWIPIILFCLVLQFSNADRNIRLVSAEQTNMNTYSKNVSVCIDCYGFFKVQMYANFTCTDTHPTTNTNNSLAVFDINGIPPHFKRDLRIEVYSVKYMSMWISTKLEPLSASPYTFNINGDERLQLPWALKSSDAVEQQGDFYYNININTTTLPTNSSTAVFSIIDNSTANGSASYLKVKAIQFNIENCDNSCLSCTTSSTTCTSCDTTCSSLSNSQCVINKSSYFLQEGKCVASCTSPHFLVNNQCVWIPNCSAVTAGSSYCTTCSTGFVPVQTSNYEAQCQQTCPNDYETVNSVCLDKKRYLQGTQLLQGLYGYTFSSFELTRLNMIYTKFVSVNNMSSKYTRCGNLQLLGGYFSFKNTSLIASQQFTTTFSYVRVSFKWVLIDYNSKVQPTSSNLTVAVLNSASGNQTISLSGITQTQLCGLDVGEYVGNFQYDFQVPSSKVTLNIYDNMVAVNSASSTDSLDIRNKYQYFGIRELSIYSLSCTQNYCLTCTSLSSGCTKCIDGYYPSSSGCSACLSECQTCSDGTTCLTCKAGRTLNSSSRCVCPSGQYWNGTSCQACSNTHCDTCSTSDSTICLTCPSGNYLSSNTCGTNCPSGYFPNSTTRTCDPCISNCSTCSNNTSCTVCNSTYYLQPNGKSCLQSCPIGYSISGSTCVVCSDTNCINCSSSVSVCTQCGNSYKLQGTVCQSSCNSSYYANSSNVCTLCSTLISNCISCDGTKCTSCSNNLSNGTCVASCPSNMYSNSKVCTLCSTQFTGCLTCTLGQCTSCASSTDYLDLTNTICSSSCPSGTFKSTTPKNQCVSCDASCLTCDTTSSSCTSCNSSLVLQGSACQLNCSNGYFQNTNGVCTLCTSIFSNCSQCTQSQCTQCASGLLVEGTNNCVSNCPSGYALDLGNMVCKRCTNTVCKSCLIDLTTCNSCYPIKPYISNNTCVASCDANSYVDSSSSQLQCSLCSSTFSNCVTCDQTECLTCDSANNYALDVSTHQCRNDCSLANTITNNSSSLICAQDCSAYNLDYCIYCPTPSGSTTPVCEQCTNSSTIQKVLYNNSCINNCPDGYYEDSYNICQQCSNLFAQCDTCTSSSCTQCSDPLFYDPVLKQCLPSCEYGAQIDSTHQCQLCDTNSNCQTCMPSDLSYCTSCDETTSNIYLQEGICVSACGTNYYLAGQSCIKCSTKYTTDCATCNSIQCISCLSTLLNANHLECDSSCPPAQYQIPGQQICQYCQNSNCGTCNSSNSNICLSCNQNSSTPYFENQDCNQSCSNQTYSDANQVCQLCSNLFPNCSQCSSTTCSLCQSTYLLDVQLNQCFYQTCPIGKYQQGNQCLSCQLGCAVCNPSIPTQCTQCISGTDFIYQGVCMSSCPSSTYQDGVQCRPCTNIDQNCLNCVIGQCTQCVAGNFYLDPLTDSCVQDCSQGYYKSVDQMTGANICQICSNSLCKTCLDDGTCLSCYPSNPYLNGITCDYTCPKFIDSTNNLCVDSCGNNSAPDPLTNICTPCTDYVFEDQCLPVCPLVTFSDSNKNCIRCPSSCEECSSSTNCTVCLPSYQNSSNSSVIQDCDECVPGYAKINGECVQCSFNCQTCSTTTTNCLTCQQDYLLDNTNHCIQCDDEQYFNTKLKECVDCNIGCLGCIESNGTVQQSTCVQCDEDLEYYLVSGDCIFCPKSDIQYFDKLKNKCVIINKDNPTVDGGATPSLLILNQVEIVDDKIVITAQISFDLQVQVINNKWNLTLDQINSDDYNISYNILQLDNQISLNASKQQAENIKVLIKISISVTSSQNYKTLFVNFINKQNVIDNKLFGLKLIKLKGDLPDYSQYKYPSMSNTSQVIGGIASASYLMLMLATPFYLLVSFFDILQLTNYLLYLNVQYPNTLYNIIKLFNFANFEVIPNVQNDHSHSPFKFRMEKIDTFIYSNLIQSAAIWSFSYILYLISKALSSRYSSSTNTIIGVFKSYYNSYYYQVMVGLGFLTYCDLVLAVFLQFYDSESISAQVIFGIVSSVALLLSIIALNLLTLQSTRIEPTSFIQYKRIQQIYGFLYEGLELNRKKAIMNLLFLFRKTIVIQQLVFNSENPVSQTYVCCLCVGVETTVMCILKPYRSSIEYKLHIISRILMISSMILIIVLAINDALQNLSQNSKEFIQIIISVQLISIYISQMSYLLTKLAISFKRKYDLANSSKLI